MSKETRRSSEELDMIVVNVVRRAGGVATGADIAKKLSRASPPWKRSAVYHVLKRLSQRDDLKMSGTRGKQVYTLPGHASQEARVRRASRKTLKTTSNGVHSNGFGSPTLNGTSPVSALIHTTDEISILKIKLRELEMKRDALVVEIDEKIAARMD